MLLTDDVGFLRRAVVPNDQDRIVRKAVIIDPLLIRATSSSLKTDLRLSPPPPLLKEVLGRMHMPLNV